MHTVVFALIGAMVGAALPNAQFIGAVAGALLGILIVRLERLRGRIDELERRFGEPAAPPATKVAAAPPAQPAPPATSVAAAPPAQPAPPATGVAAAGTAARRASPTPAHGAPAAPARPATEPTAIDRAVAAVTSWFTTGNVPVKVGVVLSVFGVGFLVKEAIDRDWIMIPLELRLLFVAVFALALLALGWRLRTRHRTYGVSLQGGGIAMLYVTIYASFALYGLLPGPLAFALLVVVTAAGGALAVLQDARVLAVLGILGGFLAPLLTSSGSGDHVLLFSYYAVLDIAIFAIAWFRAWRVLNLLGFFFTFGIGAVWGLDAWRPELFRTTEPFLVLFVALYMLIPVLFAQRAAPQLRGYVDGTLVFGTPFVAFTLQAQVVGHTEHGLAISAAVLSAAYFALAAWLLRRGGSALRVLGEAHFGLGTAFLALAIPLALDARWTSAAWALQGAAMIWLAVRQHRVLALGAGAALQAASGAALVDSLTLDALREPGFVTAPTLGALSLALAGFVSAWWLDRDRVASWRIARVGSAVFLAWATAWWLLAGLFETSRNAPAGHEIAVVMLFVAGTVLAATLVARSIRWARLASLGFIATAAIALGAAIRVVIAGHPFAGWGWAAWPALFAAHYAFLWIHEAHFPRGRAAAHVVSYWALIYLCANEAAWQVGRFADGVWPLAAALGVAAGGLLLTVRALRHPVWPFTRTRDTYSRLACGGAGAALAMVTLLANAVSSGDASPLPYIPLLNPLELASALALIAAACALRAAPAGTPPPASQADSETGPLALFAARRAAPLAAAVALFFVTMMVARAVHHWVGVPFEFDALAASTVMQAALSIVWGGAALGAMLIGARTARREVWIAGAALMAGVVVKLFVVELGNAGTVGRVVSFLGVGVLLLVVGYFAPVPPRAPAMPSPESSS